jgi:CheY-like chemotaxis protein/anti-sigma regulatory factor (Ser/Thr protein kinase)
VAGPLPDRARFYLSILREDCRRLRGTIEDILDISRIDANRMVLRRVTLPLRRLATQAAESMRLQAERKGIALTVSMGDAGFVSCDAQKVERALLNVIGNAVKYTPKGGAVQVQTVAREGDSPRVAVEVTDNGIGIGPEHLPRVAERFYRVGEQVSGTGLGLSLAKEILQLHGGGLEVVSPPPGTGEGTRVTLQLPAVRPPVVLAVDNNPEVLEVIRRQLGAEGYAVNSCRDASVALGVLQRKEADVLLCDLILPSTDGADLIAKVKGDPELRHVPIIAMTGGEVDRGKHDLLASFAIPILAKPWTREDLLGHVQEGLLGKQYL